MFEEKKIKITNKLFTASILFSIAIIIAGIIYSVGKRNDIENNPRDLKSETLSLEESVIPSEGVELPVKWSNLGIKLIESGIIDKEKLEALYSNRGGLNEEMKDFLYTDKVQNIKITEQNANFLLNLFWALGLANKNEILINGPIADPKNGGVLNFASTGGWTLARNNMIDHYAVHDLIVLNDSEQDLVRRVSQNIYRPCCNNSTYFPDCNHGMAMLGFLELMASKGLSEEKMYEIALSVNSYWFPDTYLTIAEYLKQNGISWGKTNPRDVLGVDFSSATGYRRVLSQIAPTLKNGGGSCGV